MNNYYNYLLFSKYLRYYSINESDFYIKNNEDTLLLLLLYKHLSEKQEKIENLTDYEEKNGYFFRDHELFKNIAIDCENEDEDYITNLKSGLNALKNSNNIYIHDLFETYEKSINLPEDSKNISRIIKVFSKIDKNYDNTVLYENIIYEYKRNRKDKGYFSNQVISKLMSSIINMTKEDINNVYDPSCLNGNTIIELSKENSIEKYFISEENPDFIKLLKINIILNDLSTKEIEISDKDTIYNLNFVENKFDTAISIPQSNKKITKDKNLPILSKYNLNEKSRKPSINYIYILDILYHLKDNGIAVVTFPLNVLFSRFDQEIRKYIIQEKNYLDTIIELPSNIFKNSNANMAMLIFKKNRNLNDILFINASNFYDKVGTSNLVTEENMENILDIYKNRKTIKHASDNITKNKIEKNNYNLNVSRYINSFEREIESFDEIINKIKENNKELDKLNIKIDKSLKIINSKN